VRDANKREMLKAWATSHMSIENPYESSKAIMQGFINM
jgi:hypothetical protein